MGLRLPVVAEERFDRGRTLTSGPVAPSSRHPQLEAVVPARIVVQPRSGPPVAREYAILLPPCWQYWLAITALAAPEDRGLPILFVFHGGGQDPEDFMNLFNFTQVWGRPGRGGQRAASDQFIVVYLYGWSPVDKIPVEAGDLDPLVVPAGPGRPVPSPPASYAVDPWVSRAIDQVNRDLRFATQAVPELTDLSADLELMFDRARLQRAGVWNPGPFGAASYAPQDDVAFVSQLLQTIETSLVAQMGQVPLPGGGYLGHVINPRRRYLMGYSMGGMLCYHLIHEMPGTWAAFHAMSTTCGGLLRSTDPASLAVENTPVAGPPVSLYHHHGGSQIARGSTPRSDWQEWNDLGVPPGEHGVTAPLVRPPERVDEIVDEIEHGAPTNVIRTMDAAEAAAVSHAYQTLSFAVDAFTAHHAGGGVVNVTYEPGLEDRTSTSTGHSKHAERWIYSTAGVPAEGDNPVVVEHRDGRMNHTNYFGSKNKYITVETIWDWLYAHPQI